VASFEVRPSITLEEENFTGRNRRSRRLSGSKFVTDSEFEGTKESKMSENKNAITISRRSTRLFVEEQQLMEAGNVVHMGYESRYSSGDEKERDRSQREAVTSSTTVEVLRMPVVDLGKKLCPIFPTTSEDVGKQVVKCLQAANASTKAKINSRPVNFGVVLPGTIYRSSYPTEEDYAFLATLGLKTVLSLVKSDPVPGHLASFMQHHGIRHCAIDMQGTKKVKIPEAIMHSIMKVVLDQENYPILIHCNHGKHRTGCAVAVMRHVTGWSVDAVLEEYRSFAEPKVRDCDVQYIKEYRVSSLQGLFINKLGQPLDVVLTVSKMVRMVVFSAMIMMIMLATAFFW